MIELLIILAMGLVYWLGYARGHTAGKAEVRREFFARTYLHGPLFDTVPRPSFDEWRKHALRRLDK